MRVVGQYKDTDIRLTDLHMSKTYGGWLTDPSGKRLEEANWEMINVGIPKRVEKMWGTNTALHVMDIDHKNRLPEVEVMACLKCHTGVQGKDYSHLALVWFQEPDEDPFAKVISNLKEINWEEKAEGHNWQDL